MEDSGDHGDDEVGYGKPPKSGQFKKGQSGNPSGKKPPPKLEEVLAKALAKTVPVTVGGKKQNLSMLELIIEAQVRKAAGGDVAATKLMLAIAQTYTNGEPSEAAPLNDEHFALLRDLLATPKGQEGQT